MKVFLKKILPYSVVENLRMLATEITIFLAILKRLILCPQLPNLENGEINLHLGCGKLDHPKFINIDGLPLPHIHYVQPIDRLKQFNDESVDLIYACHCLEHFTRIEVDRALTEWFRVLKNGGTLRISVPDFDCILKIYQDPSAKLEDIADILLGGQDYKYNYHFSVFNKSFLSNLLSKIGFAEIKVWQPDSDEYTIFDDYSRFSYDLQGSLYPVSLNLEAVKHSIDK
jgi:predicted SAM-dependent methyltransferase